mgnify:FL=1
MSRIIKWAGIVLGALAGAAALAVLAIYFASEVRLNQKYPLAAVPVTVPADAAALERGRYLAEHVSVCVDCHGVDFGGGLVVDDPALGRIVAPNLTTGRNGLGGQLSDEAMARVLLTGVLPDGKSVRVMPSDDYQYLSDADLGALIAYVRSRPPVDSDWPETELRPLGRLLMALGQLPIMIAERIPADQERPALPPSGVTVEHGQYLANIAGCTGCHGPGLSGGPIPGAPPDWPVALNLTPAGVVQGWSAADFIQTIRTGTDPAGHQLAEEMPWRRYAGMTDAELQALWAFVSSVPPKEFGNR